MILNVSTEPDPINPKVGLEAQSFLLAIDKDKFNELILADNIEQRLADIAFYKDVQIGDDSFTPEILADLQELNEVELKYFFSESLSTTDGEEVSTREVKRILQDLIGEEDKRKPLTDEKLAKYLKEKGYNIARRTVAKYREQLNIPVARLRKEI